MQKYFLDQFLDLFHHTHENHPQMTTVMSQRVMLFSFKDLSLSQKVCRSKDGEIEIEIKFDLKKIFA